MKQRRVWLGWVVLGVAATASAALWQWEAETPAHRIAREMLHRPADGRLTDLASVPSKSVAAPQAYALDAAVRFRIGTDPRAMATGDITGDGLDDVVVLANQSPVGIRLVMFRQLPEGGLTLDGTLSVAEANAFSGGVEIGDMNNDGRPDIVVAHSEGMSLFTAQPGGGLVRKDYTFRRFARQLALADVDADGRLDVVAEAMDASTLLVCYGDGDGGILRSAALPGSFTLKDLEVGDVTGDGLPDLVMADLGGLIVVPMGASGFGARRLYPSNDLSSTEAVATGDFNGDGRNDVAVTRGNPANVWLYHQGESGGFQPPVLLKSSATPADTFGADMDRDGRTDLLVAHMGSNRRSFHLQGDSGIGPPNLFVSSSNSWQSNRMAAVDLNSDGCTDLAGIDTAGLDVHYGRNCHAARPRIARNDVDGDGRSDLLWRSESRNDLAFWLMDGPLRRVGEGHRVGGGWDVIARGDFNGDGALDLVWSNGQEMQLWQRYGAGYQGLVMPAFPRGYRVVATGDVDGDGKADLLWRDDGNTQVALWVMEGAAVRDSRAYGLSPGWTIAAVGDLDGDRRVDLLITNGARLDAWWGRRNLLWERAAMGAYPMGWTLLDAADIDGDGRDDLLWRHAGLGYFVYWRMVGPQRIQGLEYRVGSSWRVLKSGDQTGDGKADIVWTDGTSMQVWASTGTGAFEGLSMVDYPRGWTIE